LKLITASYFAIFVQYSYAMLPGCLFAKEGNMLVQAFVNLSPGLLLLTVDVSL